MRALKVSCCVSFVSLFFTTALAADSQDPNRGGVGPDGTVHYPAFDLPLSVYVSEEAKKAFIDDFNGIHPSQVDAAHGVAKWRATMDEFVFGPKLEQARARYK